MNPVMHHSISNLESNNSPIVMKIPSKEAFSYPILVESNLLSHPENWLPNNWQQKKIVIMTDDTVSKIYGEKLFQTLQAAKPLLLSFVPGEQSKTSQIKLNLEEKMIQAQCDRETLILALGGGVVGDLAGFIAATYMRGVSYIQLPTTLLAMVDSSVGGKTGINLPQGKNLIGAFWQPTCVAADIDCLSTLPQKQMIHGLIEAIKMFATNNASYFNHLVSHTDAILNKDIPVLKTIIKRAIQIKVDIVRSDEKENNQRMILNFGHTIGHALEKISQYTLLHGHAVALGIWVEAKISQLLGYLSIGDYHSLQSLLLKLPLSNNLLKKISANEILQATKADKKMKDNQVRYVLLEKIGQVHQEGETVAHPVPDEIVLKALNEVRGE